MSDTETTVHAAKQADTPAGSSAPVSKPIPWSSLGKAAAAAFGAAATACHFIGQEAYGRYLGHWGLDSGRLPLDASGRVHYGYMAVLEGVHTLLTGQIGPLILLTVFITAGIQLWIGSLVKRSPPAETKLGKWLKCNADRLPRSLKSLFASFGISGLVVALLYYLAVLAFVALAVAPFIGGHAASKWAEHTEGEIQKGCQRKDKHSVCTQLSQNGTALGQDSSLQVRLHT